jgi:hypothetical protein
MKRLLIDTPNYTLKFTYDPNLVDFIKSTVSSSFRIYDPSAKSWFLIDPSDVVNVKAYAIRLGYQVIDNHRKSEPVRRCDHDWATMQFEWVGPTRHTAVYRALSKVLHPDTATGDHTLMVALSNAKNKLGA